MTHFALVGPEWLEKPHDEDDVVLIDTRPAGDYWAGHLAGARHIEPTLLSMQRTDAASISRFQALLSWTLSSVGVDSTSLVLVYGAANEVNVSRVAWALGYAGVERVIVLDGGLAALGATAALTQAAPAVQTKQFTVQPVGSLLATAAQAGAAGRGEGEHDGVLVDTRERDEFVGQRSNAKRDGRIPGANFWDTRQELDAAGRFRPAAALVQDFAKIAGADERIVAYCGGGGRSARTFLALQVAGYTNVAVYPASWNEWGNSDELPIAAGEPVATIV